MSWNLRLPPLCKSLNSSGLLVGDRNAEVTGVLVSLDCTEEVVAEAAACGANLIVSHHPIVFKGLKRFTESTYVERTVMAAIRRAFSCTPFTPTRITWLMA